MKILSAEEIRLWDQYTLEREPVSSIDLMERAASQCVDWIIAQYPTTAGFMVFCGKGNNGGDGLAIARMLMDKGLTVSVYILEFGHLGTTDFQTNLARLHKMPGADLHFIQSEDNFPPFDKQLLIDAFYGSGINRPLQGLTAALVDHINHSRCEIVSIDIPSGLYVDRSSAGNQYIQATHTLSFQSYKPAFLYAENANAIGEVHILDIGLDKTFYRAVNSRFELIDSALIHSIYRPRKKFSHKGNFGHALLVAGSHGKMGAAVLAAQACLRSGVGLLTCHIPGCGYDIIQAKVPEAMCITDPQSTHATKFDTDLSGFDAVGIGPGLGMLPGTKMLLREILDTYRGPVVLDADALNIVAAQKDLLQFIPAGSILSPHPKEFQRLFGETANEFDAVELALQKAKELNCIIILKGHHSFIATGSGQGFFNSTGNAGMATAGSGDVLTGILTGLLAQGYSSVETAILAVFLHGFAGDLAAREFSMEAMIASDITQRLGPAFSILNS